MRDEMPETNRESPDVPGHVLAALQASHEVAVSLSNKLAPKLHAALVLAARSGKQVEGFCHAYPHSADLITLLRAGIHIYEAAEAVSDCLYMDRQKAYRLLDYVPMANAFAGACHLSWQRVGYYAYYEGHVVPYETDAKFMRLSEHPRILFECPTGFRTRTASQHIGILAYRDFVVGTLERPLFEVVTVVIPDPQSSQTVLFSEGR
jgi:hypothetical protein